MLFLANPAIVLLLGHEERFGEADVVGSGMEGIAGTSPAL
jgi:hypothetical protein